jgi:transcriptional regulator with XRE-family HTH domain
MTSLLALERKKMINSSLALKRDISIRIKKLRDILGLTQKDLSRRLGIKITGISGIELSKQLPTIPFIIGLYKIYNISPLWLLTGAGEIMVNSLETTEGRRNYFKKAFPEVPAEPDVFRLIESMAVPVMKNALILKSLEFKEVYSAHIDEYKKTKS